MIVNAKCIVAVMLMWSSVVFAQENNKVNINGQIIDSSGLPIDYANIYLSITTDSIPVHIATSDRDGFFLFKDLTPANYQLLITHILCDSLYLNINAVRDINLGKLCMVERVNKINQAVITGSALHQFPDRYKINLKNNPTTEGKSVKEFLGYLPGVSTAQGLSVNGMGGTRVYVNGREVRDQTELEALEATNLNNVEVIYTTGSAYDAQKKGGIINIELNKLPEGGYYGTVNTGITIRPQYGFSGDNSNSIFNYRYKKLSLYNYISYNDFKNIYDYDMLSRYHISGVSLQSNSTERWWVRSFSEHISVVYDFNDKHSLGGYFRVGLSNSDPNKVSYSLISNPDNSVDNSYSDILSKVYKGTYQGAINYVWRLGNNGSNFKIIADYMKNNNLSRSHYNSVLRGASNEQVSKMNDDLSNMTDMAELDAKFELKLTDNSTLITGGRVYAQSTHRELLYEDYMNDTWITDSNLSDHFKVNGNGYGVFADFRSAIGRFSYNAGVRIQQDNISHNSMRTGQKVNKQYFNIFPTVSMGYSLPDKEIFFNLSYSRGLDYIPYNEISPAIVWQSEFSYSKGNPNLYPTLDNFIQFSSSLKGWNVYYNFYCTKDEIYYLTFLDKDSPLVKYSMPVNAGTSYYHIAGLGRNFKVTKWWDCNIYMQIRGYKIYFEDKEKERHKSSISFLPSVNNSFRFSGQYGAFLDFRAETTSKIDDKTMLGVYSFGVGVYGNFFDKRLLVRINSQPLYSKLRNMMISKDDYWSMNRFKTVQTGISISATYNFKGGKQDVKVSRSRAIQSIKERSEERN